MKNLNLFIICTFCTFSTVFAQVGIGTTTPVATLDVEGTVRIKTLPVELVEDISLTGLTSGNTLNRTDTGTNVIVINNYITTAPVARDIGDNNLGLEPMDSNSSGLGQIYNWDFDIGAGEQNETATFINVHSYTLNYKIAGIKNGSEGRRVTLFFEDSANIDFSEDDALAFPRNRILTLTNSGISTSGEGFIEVVYDADAGSDGLGRWLVIKFRN